MTKSKHPQMPGLHNTMDSIKFNCQNTGSGTTTQPRPPPGWEPGNLVFRARQSTEKKRKRADSAGAAKRNAEKKSSEFVDSDDDDDVEEVEDPEAYGPHHGDSDDEVDNKAKTKKPRTQGPDDDAGDGGGGEAATMLSEADVVRLHELIGEYQESVTCNTATGKLGPGDTRLLDEMLRILEDVGAWWSLEFIKTIDDVGSALNDYLEENDYDRTDLLRHAAWIIKDETAKNEALIIEACKSASDGDSILFTEAILAAEKDGQLDKDALDNWYRAGNSYD